MRPLHRFLPPLLWCHLHREADPPAHGGEGSTLFPPSAAHWAGVFVVIDSAWISSTSSSFKAEFTRRCLASRGFPVDAQQFAESKHEAGEGDLNDIFSDCCSLTPRVCSCVCLFASTDLGHIFGVEIWQARDDKVCESNEGLPVSCFENICHSSALLQDTDTPSRRCRRYRGWML